MCQGYQVANLEILKNDQIYLWALWQTPIVYDYVITQALIYILMESYFLKNYDPRHLVFELLSGQTANGGPGFQKHSFHYLQTGQGNTGGTMCYKETGETTNICI